MTNTIWGGRFAASPAEIMEEINASIDFDKRLWRHDLAASKAHVAMLAATGIIDKAEADKIMHGLDQILAEMEAGKFKFSRKLEDIHLNVEHRLTELSIESADAAVCVRRGGHQATPESEPQVVAAGAPVAEIRAPLLGVFYRAPAPDAPPYVGVGDWIQSGQTVGLIEAMKVFNEINSEIEGRVVAIAFLIELAFLHGRDKLRDYEVHSLLTF